MFNGFLSTSDMKGFSKVAGLSFGLGMDTMIKGADTGVYCAYFFVLRTLFSNQNDKSLQQMFQ